MPPQVTVRLLQLGGEHIELKFSRKELAAARASAAGGVVTAVVRKKAFLALNRDVLRTQFDMDALVALGVAPDDLDNFMFYAGGTVELSSSRFFRSAAPGSRFAPLSETLGSSE